MRVSFVNRMEESDMKTWKMIVALFVLLFAFSLMGCSKGSECAKKCDEAVAEAKKQAGGNEEMIKQLDEGAAQCKKACEAAGQ